MNYQVNLLVYVIMKNKPGTQLGTGLGSKPNFCSYRWITNRL